MKITKTLDKTIIDITKDKYNILFNFLFFDIFDKRGNKTMIRELLNVKQIIINLK